MSSEASSEALRRALVRCGQDWRAHLREAARSPEKLLEYGIINASQRDELISVNQRYETLITPYYLALIDQNDLACPIRLQSIPKGEELLHLPGEDVDPIGDQQHKVGSILVHRYPDRALLFPTFRCPMFCRYCFRKEALNSDEIKLHQALPHALAYLDEHPEIKEIILSGGDPLMLSNARLISLLKALEQRARRIRIHTRFPVTLPYRIDQDLVEGLGQFRQLNLVTHFNHPRELSTVAQEALERLRYAGVRVLNQTVLLAGVNDRLATLKELFLGLLDVGVTPYYLHHPDLTAGTQHFRISLRQGLALTRALRGSLSGLAIPTYVIDVPKGGGKVPVDSSFVEASADPKYWTLQSPLTGERHLYVDLAEQDEINA